MPFTTAPALLQALVATFKAAAPEVGLTAEDILLHEYIPVTAEDIGAGKLGIYMTDFDQPVTGPSSAGDQQMTASVLLDWTIVGDPVLQTAPGIAWQKRVLKASSNLGGLATAIDCQGTTTGHASGNLRAGKAYTLFDITYLWRPE